MHTEGSKLKGKRHPMEHVRAGRKEGTRATKAVKGGINKDSIRGDFNTGAEGSLKLGRAYVLIKCQLTSNPCPMGILHLLS